MTITGDEVTAPRLRRRSRLTGAKKPNRPQRGLNFGGSGRSHERGDVGIDGPDNVTRFVCAEAEPAIATTRPSQHAKEKRDTRDEFLSRSPTMRWGRRTLRRPPVKNTVPHFNGRETARKSDYASWQCPPKSRPSTFCC